MKKLEPKLLSQHVLGKNSHCPPRPEVERSRATESSSRTECPWACCGHSPHAVGGVRASKPAALRKCSQLSEKKFTEMARSCCCGIILALHQPCEGWRAIPNCHAMLCVVCTSCPSPLCAFVCMCWLHVLVPPTLLFCNEFEVLFRVSTSTVFAF